jgi:hypothetical protein
MVRTDERDGPRGVNHWHGQVADTRMSSEAGSDRGFAHVETAIVPVEPPSSTQRLLDTQRQTEVQRTWRT